MLSNYANLANVACNIFSIVPHGGGVDACFSLGRDVMGWRQSKTTGETLHEKVVVWQFARANNGILADTDPALDTMNTENDSEMKKEAKNRIFPRIAKVYNFLEMWQGSHYIRVTKKDFRAQTMQMITMVYISNTDDIVKASWLLFQHNGAAAFKLSEQSPLPPAWTAKDLLGGRTQMLDVRRNRWINRDPVASDGDIAPESILDSEDWLNWNSNLNNPNDTEEDCAGDDDSDIEHNNGIEDPECTEQHDVIAAPNAMIGSVRPTRTSKRQAEQSLLTVNAGETQRNKGRKKK
jgi:hypothetical protein